MVTIANIVEKMVMDRPLLQESILQDIVSFGNLAELIKPEIEAELRKDVKESAIVMALRRLAEKMQEKEKVESKKSKVKLCSEVNLKTGLIDISVVKSPALMKKISSLYNLCNPDRGDMFNIVHGNYEVAIITNERHLERLQKELKSEKIMNIEKDLVALSMSFTKDFFYTPGVISKISRQLAWNNINITELISTMTEMTFILHKKDATKAYNTVNQVFSDKKS